MSTLGPPGYPPLLGPPSSGASPEPKESKPTVSRDSTASTSQQLQIAKVSSAIDRWKDSDRRKLSQEGYRTLAILATFMAAVQAPLLSSSFFRGHSTSSQIVTMFFIWGLIADLFGAVLNYGSARWFEMLTMEEAKYLQEIWVAAETGKTVGEPDRDPTFIEQWLALSVKMGYYAALLGLIMLLAGLLVSVWTQWDLRPAIKIILTVMCALFSALIPPFACKHDRKATLYLLKLRRWSG